MPATICIVSEASSPIVILPPIVTLPVTSKLPVKFTFEFKFISPPAAVKLASCVSVSIVFPLIRQSPVSILFPSINVVFPSVLKVTPSVVLIVKSVTAKSTVPSSWFT